MRTVHTVKDLRATIKQQREAGKRIAFVPTMGNLHEGHIALVKRAINIADYVVTSIFVNPMQFGKNEDLDAYPKTLSDDQRHLEEAGNHLVFAPSVAEIYPNGMSEQTQVIVPTITERHCGASRPGHFTGVATVVTMLFNMVQPDVAIFGEKDFQQLAIIRKMVKDLAMPIKILSKPTIREKNGLAMSSRNNNLSKELRPRAFLLNQTLNFMREEIISGNRDYPQLIKTAKQTLKIHGFKPEYIVIANQENLQEANNKTTKIVILAAAYLGFPRLIDNVCVEINN